MLLILVVGLTAAFLPVATGTSLFNRNVGLLRAFKGTDENNNNRDTEGKVRFFLNVPVYSLHKSRDARKPVFGVSNQV